MLHYLKLFRIQNLLIIVLTQYLFRYFILLPILQNNAVLPILNDINFALLVLSTVLIAAAGYAINDYFDIRTDRINHPHKIIVGKYISRRIAMLLHQILNIIAVIIAAYVCYKTGSFKLLFIQIIMITLLWMYSVKFKSYFLIGNILVAFSSAMTILIVWVFDIYAVNSSGQLLNYTTRESIRLFLWTFATFAFVVSIIREIIKDIEDIEGDEKIGCATIPIVIGIPKTKLFLYSFIILSIIPLGYFLYKTYMMPDMLILFWYIIFALIIPFIYLAYLTFIAKNKNDFSILSKITKFIMLAGVLSMILIF